AYVRGLIAVTLVLLAFGVTVYLLRLADPLRPGTFERLRLGMTEHEVRATIGLPPGDYYRGPRGLGGITSRGPFGLTIRSVGDAKKEHPRSCDWWGDRYAIAAGFDSRGAAVTYRQVRAPRQVLDPPLPQPLAAQVDGPQPAQPGRSEERRKVAR